MQIRLIEFRHFRGFEAATIRPSGHVVLVGEQRAGRSDVVEGLTRVFLPDATRVPLTDDLDFYGRDDRSRRSEVEVILGDLGDQLTQTFFDQLEYWDWETGELIEALDDVQDLDDRDVEPVVRLCYRAAWSEEDDQADHWVDYPKTSDEEAGVFERIRRVDREEFPFFAGERGDAYLALQAGPICAGS